MKLMIRSRSIKRAKQEREYKVIRDRFLCEHFSCAVCGEVTLDLCVHHMRGRIGSLLTDERYFLPVCPDCHLRIELNPIWAKEHGYSLTRTI